MLVAGDLYDSAAPSADAQRLVVRTLMALARHRRAGRRDRREPRPRRHLRRVPAASPGPPGSRSSGSVRTAETGGWSSSPPGRRASVPRSPCCRSCPSATRCGPRSWSRRPRPRTPARTTSTVRESSAALTAGFRTDAVNLVMAHLTVLGGTFGGGERAAQSIFEYSVPAGGLPAGRPLRRARPPAPAPGAGRAGAGALLRRAAGRRLRRAGQHERRLLVEATPTTPARVTDIPITAGRRLRTVHGTVAELAGMGGDLGDDLLRVVVRERARAGLREEVTELLPNALEVRIDPEFAAAVTGSRPSTGARTAAPASCSASTWARGRSTTGGWRSCSRGCTTGSATSRSERRRAPDAAGAAGDGRVRGIPRARPSSTSRARSTSRWSGRRGPESPR